MTKLKITVLKRQDPDEIFDELPVKRKDWMVPCPIYEDGQEYILDRIAMPEGFCGWAWHDIYKDMSVIKYGGNFPWVKEGEMITCCTDGIRPVSFKMKRIE